MGSAAAEFGEQVMRSRRELKSDRDQRTVDLDADISGKLEDKACRAGLHVGTAADPCAAIGKDPAEPWYDRGLVFAQKSGQVENIICKRVGHKGIEWFACYGS
jgi:hypothetical protein